VIVHTTGLNKWDEATGIEALLPPLYRQGLKRLPKRHGDLDAPGFVTKFTKELTQYPESATNDLVVADWQAEWNMARILAAARRTDGPVWTTRGSPGTCAVSSTRSRSVRRRCSHETAEEPVISGGGMECSRPHPVIYVT